jgi:hypothetical protein
LIKLIGWEEVDVEEFKRDVNGFMSGRVCEVVSLLDVVVDEEELFRKLFIIGLGALCVRDDPDDAEDNDGDLKFYKLVKTIVPRKRI